MSISYKKIHGGYQVTVTQGAYCCRATNVSRKVAWNAAFTSVLSLVMEHGHG